MKKPANGHQGRTGRFSLMSSEKKRKPPTLPRVEFMERTAWIEDDPEQPRAAMRRPLRVDAPDASWASDGAKDDS